MAEEDTPGTNIRKHREARGKKKGKTLYRKGRNQSFSFHKTLPGAVSASDDWLLLSEFRFCAFNA